MNPIDTTDLAKAFEPVVRDLVPAVAKGEPVLLVGAPGVGKTMLARRMVGAVTHDDHAKAWLAAEYEGVFGERPRDLGVPFRAPHYTISEAAMRGSPWGWKHHVACSTISTPWCVCGLDHRKARRALIPTYVKTDPEARGGVWTPGRPGEVELARFGVLYLDELGEFPRCVVEATAERLRKMADGRPRVIAAVDPCACGWSGATVRQCVCTEASIARWNDRIDQFAKILGITTRITVPSLGIRDLQAQRDSPRCPSIQTILAGAV